MLSNEKSFHKTVPYTSMLKCKGLLCTLTRKQMHVKVQTLKNNDLYLVRKCSRPRGPIHHDVFLYYYVT